MENNPSKMIAGKTYKIERNHKCIKIIFNSRKDSAIVVTRHFEQEQIPIKEITGIRKRKFSIVKTLLLPPTIAAVLTGLFVLSYQ